jgi:excisionase family DNA binding protein
MSEELLTSTEAARLLRVSKSTIARYVRLGQLRAYRLPSGYLRFRREDVEALLELLGDKDDPEGQA